MNLCVDELLPCSETDGSLDNLESSTRSKMVMNGSTIKLCDVRKVDRYTQGLNTRMKCFWTETIVKVLVL